MNKKYILFFMIIWLVFQPFESTFASLSTRVRITAVKGKVTTQLLNPDKNKVCSLERTLNLTESRVTNGKVKIKTGNDSYAQIEYPDHSKFKISPNTEIIIQSNKIYVKSGATWFSVEKQKNGKLIIETPTAIAGIRGTKFTINVANDGSSTCRLIEGSIEISDAKEKSKMLLSPGMEVTIKKGSSTLIPAISNIKEDDRWWTDWPTLVPISEMPSDPDHPGTIHNTSGNVLYPIADSYVYAYDYAGWSKANWGTHVALAAGWHPTGGEQRAYLKFDVSKLGFNNNAKFILKLYYNHLGGNNTVDLGIYEVTSNWVEGRGTYQPSTPALAGELSWINQPVTATYPEVLFNPGRKVPDWIEVDVTPLVKKWINGSPNYGMVIRPTGNFTRQSAAQYGFMSREFEEADKRPQIIISSQSVSTNSNLSNAVANPCGSDKAFIRSLYQSILDREMEAPFSPGHGGGQLQNLQNGDSRWKVIYSIFNSPEYKNKQKSHPEFIRDAYQAILAREPKANEVKAWPQIDRNTILIKFINLDEYRNLLNDCPDHKPVVNVAYIAGPWSLNQDNGYTGSMILQQSSDGHLSGNVIWNGYLKGTIDGQISGNTVSITIDYHNGDIGYYKGTLTSDGNRIVNGTVNGNNGVHANWSGIKNTSSSTTMSNHPTNHTNLVRTDQPWILGIDNYAYYATKSGWKQPPVGGIGKDIAVDANGKIWLIGGDNSIYYYEGAQWVQYPGGKALAICVSLDGTPWIIGTNNHIYYGTGSGWEQKSGGMGKDIAVDGSGRPWVIGTDNGIWYHNGSAWVEYPGGGRGLAISVSRDGTPWVIGMYNHIHHGTGLGWVELSGGGIGKDIAIDANGRPWVIGSNNGIHYYNGVKWVEHSGRGKGYRISVVQ